MTLTNSRALSHTGETDKAESATKNLGGGSHVRWYAAQAHQQQESRAAYQISRQGFRAWLPQIATGPLDATVIRVMFPGYLFVQFDITRDQWRPIAHTLGVRRLFGSTPEKPTPVREGIVEALMARGRASDGVYDARVPPPSLVGQHVRVTAGPFVGFEGICGMSDSERVQVMLTMFGRETAIGAKRGDVEIVSAN
jgi:transcriptional antiterminator RfaH